MLHQHSRRNPELQEELQIQAAVVAGDVHTVRKMLEQGYSPNGRDANSWTLLHFSAARGKERCVRVFLEHGGQPRNLQDLCRIKIRQCIGLQNLKLLDELPIAKVMKDYLTISRVHTTVSKIRSYIPDT
uniref:SOCS box domain-containing protein n=1 Tax=Suricata suricatta TaxID=37032 RepID=A0A673UPS1_SURSU